jgi:hypothetical protein
MKIDEWCNSGIPKGEMVIIASGTNVGRSMVSYYGNASMRLFDWVAANPPAYDKFMRDWSVTDSGQFTLLQYLGHYSYRQDILERLRDALGAPADLFEGC